MDLDLPLSQRKGKRVVKPSISQDWITDQIWEESSDDEDFVPSDFNSGSNRSESGSESEVESSESEESGTESTKKIQKNGFIKSQKKREKKQIEENKGKKKQKTDIEENQNGKDEKIAFELEKFDERHNLVYLGDSMIPIFTSKFQNFHRDENEHFIKIKKVYQKSLQEVEKYQSTIKELRRESKELKEELETASSKQEQLEHYFQTICSSLHPIFQTIQGELQQRGLIEQNEVTLIQEEKKNGRGRRRKLENSSTQNSQKEEEEEENETSFSSIGQTIQLLHDKINSETFPLEILNPLKNVIESVNIDK